MTDRKPPGVSWESWIDRKIREGVERGEFDGLRGAGKPLPDVDRPRDELWWVKQKMRRENLSYLPPTLAIRKERDEALDRIARARSESVVREIVAEVNARIRHVNSTAIDGPPSTVMPLDVEDVVQKWRAERPSA